MTEQELKFKIATEIAGRQLTKQGINDATDAIYEILKEQLLIQRVSQQRELLIAYEKNHYTPQEWALASKQCIEDIDNFLAINCG